MHWWTNSRLIALGFTSVGCLVGCADSPTPSTADNAVETAYAALVADVASCAKEVKSCVDAAGDDEVAVDTCRDEFATCRQDAGKGSVDKLANAARSCTAKRKECVAAAPDDRASCHEEQRACLSASRDEKKDDGDDAGPDGDARKAARSDCLDELHICVQADGPANACAEQVRTCVVDSVPTALAVVPKDDKGKGSSKRGDAGVGGGKPDKADAADGGVRGKPEKADGGVRGKPEKADGGVRGKPEKADATDGGVPDGGGDDDGDKGTMSDARVCVDTFQACIEADNAARACARSLKDCRAAAKP
jgi:hypothetical protein